ncbi:MAG: E3 binding domain-containing protein [Trueperaceae bacterium]|nr:MAG: E3 binding domain-containing protein [Trueperaceae bacterium]
MNEPDISPLARRLAEENNVDWQSLSGTGADGKVVERDVLEYLARVMTGDAALDPTPEPVPDGMDAWPEEDVVAGYQPRGVNLDQLQAELSASSPSYDESTPGSALDAPPPADLVSDEPLGVEAAQNSDLEDGSFVSLEQDQDDDDDLLEIDDVEMDVAPPAGVSVHGDEEEAISEDIFLFDDGVEQAEIDVGEVLPATFQQEVSHADGAGYSGSQGRRTDPEGPSLEVSDIGAGLGDSFESAPIQESVEIPLDAFEEEVRSPSLAGEPDIGQHDGSSELFSEAISDSGGEVLEGETGGRFTDFAQVPDVFADNVDGLSSDLAPELFVSDEEALPFDEGIGADTSPNSDFQEMESEASFVAGEGGGTEALQGETPVDEPLQSEPVDSFGPESHVLGAGAVLASEDEEAGVQVGGQAPGGFFESSNGESQEMSVEPQEMSVEPQEMSVEPQEMSVESQEMSVESEPEADRSIGSLADVGKGVLDEPTDQLQAEEIPLPLVSYGMLLRRHLDLTSLAEAQLAVSRELSEDDPISPTPFLVRAVAKAMEMVRLGDSPPELALAVITGDGFGTKMISDATEISFRSLLNETRDAVGSDVMNGATLVVADMSSLEVDEAVLNLGVPVLTLGRILFDNQQGRYHSTLSLSGTTLPPEEGAKLLVYVADLLNAPVQLVL